MLRPVVGPHVMPPTHQQHQPQGFHHPAHHPNFHPAQMMSQAQAFYLQQQQTLGSGVMGNPSGQLAGPAMGHAVLPSNHGAAPAANTAATATGGGPYGSTGATMTSYGHGPGVNVHGTTPMSPMMQRLVHLVFVYTIVIYYFSESLKFLIN